MPKQCSVGGCKNIAVTDTYRCERHPITFTPKKKYEHHHHDGKNIYSSNRWKKLSKQFRQHNPICAICEKMGIVTSAQMVDHIVEIKDGGGVYDIDNLQSLCNGCHNTKTGEEVKKRTRRNKSKGFGLLSDY